MILKSHSLITSQCPPPPRPGSYLYVCLCLILAGRLKYDAYWCVKCLLCLFYRNANLFQAEPIATILLSLA